MNLDGMRNVLLGAGLVVVAFVLWMLLAGGCQLHHPANVEPDYPPGPPMGSDYPADGEIVVTYPDDSPQALASPCGIACLHIKSLQCQEGGPTCYRACVHQVALEHVPMACWQHASTVADLRACGPQIRCLP